MRAVLEPSRKYRTLLINLMLNNSFQVWWPEYESQEELYDRVSTFKKWVAYRPEQNIAIVSHGGFLYALLRVYFANCEARLMDWDSLQQ